MNVAHDRPVAPDLADSARLYMRLLLSEWAPNWPPSLDSHVQGVAGSLAADDGSLTAERIRGAVMSHRGWIAEDRTTIAFADLIEREFGGFVPPPGYAD